MIYVSSSCVRAVTIGEAVRKLADEGFTAIELSGGTRPYAALERDLLSLQKEYDLHYLCHNYFPPPEKNFVVNLASLDPVVADMSMAHLRRGMALSRKLGADKFGFHAGFLIDIPVDEVGKAIANRPLFDSEKSMHQFVQLLSTLEQEADGLKLYVENNVVSGINLKNYNGQNPFFVTDADGYNALRTRSDARLLLDVAHLKVSCQSLGLDFEEQLRALIVQTDYVHVSDNDGHTDNNKGFYRDSELWKQMAAHDLKGKTFTLEIYSGMQDLKSGFAALNEIC